MGKKDNNTPVEKNDKKPTPPKAERGELGIARVDENTSLTDSTHMGDELPEATGNALENIQARELDALASAQESQYANMGDVISGIETRMSDLQKEDKDAQRRANAFRYITGIGDTLAGVANLVGTAHGAQNQERTPSSSTIVEKANADIARRKEKYDDLNERLTEAKARQAEMQTAHSLETMKLKTAQEKERIKEKSRLATEAKEDAYRMEKLRQGAINAQANVIRANAAATNAEKPKTTSRSTAKPKMASFAGRDGTSYQLDVSGIANEDRERKRAVINAINADIEAYKNRGELKNFTAQEIENYLGWKEFQPQKAEQFIKDNLNHPAVGEHFQDVMGKKVTSVTRNYQ